MPVVQKSHSVQVGSCASVPRNSVGSTLSVGGRRSVVTRVASMFGSSKRRELDEDWVAGSSYNIHGVRVLMWSTSELSGPPVAALHDGDEFTLLDIATTSTRTLGMVLPRTATGVHSVGWTVLEAQGDDSEGGHRALRCHIPKRSWTLKGRYQLLFKATIRAGKDLQTEALRDLPSGDEVLVLDFGYNDGDKELPRLRLKVASDAGIIGWITGITTNGEALVECTNLLAPEIVGLRRSHRESQRRSIIGPLVGPSKSYESGAGRFRRRWLPTGQYRVLQYTHVFSDADVASEIVSELEPGWTVEILSLQPGGSHQRPMACATLLPERVVRGWVLLQSKGFDIIDTRDLSEYEKVQAYLSHMEGDATADDEDDDAEEDEEEESDTGEAEDLVQEGAKCPSAEKPSDATAPEGIVLDIDMPAVGPKPAKRGSACAPPATKPLTPSCAQLSAQHNVLASLIGQPCVVGCFKQ